MQDIERCMIDSGRREVEARIQPQDLSGLRVEHSNAKI
jgi:hypothetical protein